MSLTNGEAQEEQLWFKVKKNTKIIFYYLFKKIFLGAVYTKMVKYKHILLACAVAKPGFHAQFFIVSISFLQNERIMCDINLCTTYA